MRIDVASFAVRRTCCRAWLVGATVARLTHLLGLYNDHVPALAINLTGERERAL
jgi:hypothetical protein